MLHDRQSRRNFFRERRQIGFVYKRVQEGDQIALLLQAYRIRVDLVVYLRLFEPNTWSATGRIKIENLLERLESPVVHVRGVQHHVAKRRHLEGILVAFPLGDIEPAVVMFLTFNFRNSNDLEVAVGKSWYTVTLKATCPPGPEQVEAALLFRRQRIHIAGDEVIEWRIVRGERAFKRCYGLQDIVHRDSRAAASLKRRIEPVRVFRDGLQLGHQSFRILVHFDIAGNRSASLLLQIRCAAVPELHVVIGCIPQARRAALYDSSSVSLGAEALAALAHGESAAVAKAEVRMVTVSA